MQIIEKENEIKEIKTEAKQEPEVSELPLDSISEKLEQDDSSKEESDKTDNE